MQEHHSIDYLLFGSILILVLFGSIMISSVSVFDSYRITKQLVENGTLVEPNNWRFIFRNILHVCMGISAMVLAIKVPYLWWKKSLKILSAITIILLVLVLTPLGIELNGAQGWFNIPGIPFSLQPTEFLKLTIILGVATLCTRYKILLSSLWDGFFPFFGLLLVPCILVLLQPDLGALLIIIPVAVSMYFVAGGNVRILITGAFIGICAALFLYVLGSYDTPEEKTQFSYIYDRMNTFLGSNRISIENNTMHHQNKQALIAIGSGGVTGLGFGKSVQKYGYLPEPQGDFIFSIITEELGLIGALMILSIYLFVVYRGFVIASLCDEPFGKYVAFGITFWIFWQVILNISVNLSIFPNTGLTLPFISYGGSSLLMMLTAAGILLSISRETTDKKKTFKYFSTSFLLGKIRR